MIKIKQINSKKCIIWTTFFLLLIVFDFFRTTTVRLNLTSLYPGQNIAFYYHNGNKRPGNTLDEKHRIDYPVKDTLFIQEAVFNIPKKGLKTVMFHFGNESGEIQIQSLLIDKPFFKKILISGEDIPSLFHLLDEKEKYRVLDDGRVELFYKEEDSLIISADLSQIETGLDLGKVVGSIGKNLVILLICFGIWENRKGIRRIAGNTWNPSIAFALFLGFLIVVFISIPLSYTVDSVWYLSFLKYFEGRAPFQEWDTTRGWIFPAILYGFSKIFGLTSQGLLSLFLFFYFLFLLVYWKLLKVSLGGKLKILQYFLLLTLSLDPIIFGYFHVILVEFIGATICGFNIYVILKTHYRLLENDERCIRVIRYTIFGIHLLVMYNLKQTYVACIFIPFFISEAALWFQSFSIKKVILTFCMMGVFSICFFTSLLGWQNYLNTGNFFSSTSEEDGKDVNQITKDYLNSFLKQGAIYFRPDREEKGLINVLNEDLNVIDSFEYQEKDGFVGSIHYIWTCFTKKPKIFIKGYVDNYFTLANVYEIGIDPQIPIKDISFTRGNENIYVAMAYQWYNRGTSFYDRQGYDQYKEIFDYEDMEQFHYPVDNSRVIDLMFHINRQKIACFLYTFILIMSPFIAICSLVMIVYKRKKCKINETMMSIFLCSSTIFGNGLFLTMLNQRIDRYAFPIYPIGLLCLALIVYELWKSLRGMSNRR